MDILQDEILKCTTIGTTIMYQECIHVRKNQILSLFNVGLTLTRNYKEIISYKRVF